MSGSEIMAVVGFFIVLMGSVGGVWLRIEAKVRAAEDKAAKVAEDLAKHKLHVAEQYITKAGMRETTDQIMGALGGLKQSVDNMTLRVDRIVENQAKPRTRSTS